MPSANINPVAACYAYVAFLSDGELSATIRIEPSMAALLTSACWITPKCY